MKRTGEHRRWPGIQPAAGPEPNAAPEYARSDRRAAARCRLQIDGEHVFGEVLPVVDRSDLGNDFDPLLGQRLPQRPTAIRLITHDLRSESAGLLMLGEEFG